MSLSPVNVWASLGRDTIPPALVDTGRSAFAALNTDIIVSGYTAEDALDGPLTRSLIPTTDVYTGYLGQQTVTFRVFDTDGNSSEIELPLNVVGEYVLKTTPYTEGFDGAVPEFWNTLVGNFTTRTSKLFPFGTSPEWMCLYFSDSNFHVQGVFNLGNSQSRAGLVFRAVDVNNLYFLEAASDGSLSLVLRDRGAETTLWTGSGSVPLNGDFTLGIKTNVGSIEILVNGVSVGNVTDSTHLYGTGTGGLFTSALQSLDEFKIAQFNAGVDELLGGTAFAGPVVPDVPDEPDVPALDRVPDRYEASTNITTINRIASELEKIQESLADHLSRKGTGPNMMEAPLDINSQRIINLPAPRNLDEPARLRDLLAGNNGADDIVLDFGEVGLGNLDNELTGIISNIGVNTAAIDAAEAAILVLNDVTLPDLRLSIDQTIDELAVLNSQTLANLEQSISDAQADIDALNNVTLPAIDIELNDLDVALNTLNTVTLPQVNTDIQAVRDDITDLNTVTLPAVNNSITAVEGDILTLNNTTIPGVNSAIDNINNVVVPDLEDQIAQAVIDAQDLTGLFPVSTTNISDNSITTPKLVTNAVTADKILANAITAVKIAALAVTTDKLAANAVTAAKIEALTITAAQIAANTISADKLVANTITADEIAALTITAAEIATNAITSDKIVANAITADKIAALTITADELAANSVNASKIVANSIGTSELTANSVTSDKIAANSVDTSKLTANSVTASKIAGLSITGDKIAANTISGDKIVSNSITTDKLGALSVTSDKIAANSISADMLIANSITGDKIAANALDARTITSPSIIGGSIRSGVIEIIRSGRMHIISPSPFGPDDLIEWKGAQNSTTYNSTTGEVRYSNLTKANGTIYWEDEFGNSFFGGDIRIVDSRIDSFTEVITANPTVTIRRLRSGANPRAITSYYTLDTELSGGPFLAPSSTPPSVSFTLQRRIDFGSFQNIATSPTYTGTRSQTFLATNFFKWEQDLNAEWTYTDNTDLGNSVADYRVVTSVFYNMAPTVNSDPLTYFQRLDLVSLEL